MSPPKKVLIVGGAASHLEDMRLVLGELGARWSLHFVEDSRQALELLSADEDAVGAIVAEPEQWLRENGTLLDELKLKHPSVAPVCLSLPPPSAMTRAPNAVESLANATDAESLGAALDRTQALHEVLNNPAARRLVDAIDQLPSLPTTYLALMQASANPTSTIEEFTAIIQSDPAMSGRVLQLVNSSFFGLKSRVKSVTQAVSYLGLGLLKGLTASAHVFGALDASPKKVLSVERCQLYSVRVARLAQRMASNTRAAEEAFTAGMLHNIGELVLALERPDAFSSVIQRCIETGERQVTLEREVFGVTHPEVGAQLLSKWGMPYPIVEVAAFHHEPQRVVGANLEVLGTVHTADALAGIMTCGDPESMLDIAFLERAHLARHLPRWRRLAEQEIATWTSSD